MGGDHSILGGLLTSSAMMVTEVRASSARIALQTNSGLEGPGSNVVLQTQTDVRKADVDPGDRINDHLAVVDPHAGLVAPSGL